MARLTPWTGQRLFVLPDLGKLSLSCVAEELNDVVKTSRVWHVRFNDGIQLVEVISEHTATHHTFTSVYQVHIAFQCVDLSIVSYVPTHTHTLPRGWSNANRQTALYTDNSVNVNHCHVTSAVCCNECQSLSRDISCMLQWVSITVTWHELYVAMSVNHVSHLWHVDADTQVLMSL